MSLKIRENCRYAVACPTSMGVRITPDGRMAVHNSNHFYLQATSAESNVLNVASSLGRECLVLTKFVKGSPVAQLIKNDLRSRNIAYEGVEVDQGGPWGYRHQFNIADSGFGLRAPRVWNDRAGEVGRTPSADEFDLDRSFLSYTRHEYFRRILCDLIGGWVEQGHYPDDLAFVGGMVEDISFRNAKRYFQI